MARTIAKLICLTIAYIAAHAVYREVTSVAEGYVPWTAGGITVLIVFGVFYFPLARPLADTIGDKVAATLHRGRHVRTGSGLDEIPDAPKTPPCSICGDPRGPICPDCNEKMAQSRKKPIQLDS